MTDDPSVTAETLAPYERVLDLAYVAWGIIANAHGGNWDEASDEWRGAAERWRDAFHAELNLHLSDGEPT